MANCLRCHVPIADGKKLCDDCYAAYLRAKQAKAQKVSPPPPPPIPPAPQPQQYVPPTPPPMPVPTRPTKAIPDPVPQTQTPPTNGQQRLSPAEQARMKKAQGTLPNYAAMVNNIPPPKDTGMSSIVQTATAAQKAPKQPSLAQQVKQPSPAQRVKQHAPVQQERQPPPAQQVQAPAQKVKQKSAPQVPTPPKPAPVQKAPKEKVPYSLKGPFSSNLKNALLDLILMFGPIGLIICIILLVSADTDPAKKAMVKAYFVICGIAIALCILFSLIGGGITAALLGGIVS